MVLSGNTMKKTDKKIEKALRDGLIEVCEKALGSVQGFVWLTHLVNFNDFPNSLKVICVFEEDCDLSNLFDSKQDDYLRHLIDSELKAVNISIKTLHQQIDFDTEEACQRSHNGKWNDRLNNSPKYRH